MGLEGPTIFMVLFLCFMIVMICYLIRSFIIDKLGHTNGVLRSNRNMGTNMFTKTRIMRYHEDDDIGRREWGVIPDVTYALQSSYVDDNYALHNSEGHNWTNTGGHGRSGGHGHGDTGGDNCHTGDTGGCCDTGYSSAGCDSRGGDTGGCCDTGDSGGGCDTGGGDSGGCDSGGGGCDD